MGAMRSYWSPREQIKVDENTRRYLDQQLVLAGGERPVRRSAAGAAAGRSGADVHALRGMAD